MTNVENIIDEIESKIEKFSGLIETVTENDIVKTAIGASGIINTAVRINNIVIQKRFESYLKGFSDNKPTEEQLLKLEKYINSPEKAEFIADTFRKVLLSNSSKATLIMGTIMNSVLEEQKEISHEMLICLNALSQFYDVDIINFKLLYEFKDYLGSNELKIPKLSNRNKKVRKAFYISSRKFKQFASEKNITQSSLLITLEKCIGLQLIIRELEPDIDVDIDIEMESADVRHQEIDEKFTFSSAGEIMSNLITRI